jgi:transposase
MASDLGGDLGRAEYGVARAAGPRGQPLGCGPRQSIGQISGKGGGKNTQVDYDGGKRVKGWKIHALVDCEGPPMRVVFHSAAIQRRGWTGPRRDPRAFFVARTDLGRWGYNAWQVEAAVARVPRLRMEIVKRSDDMRGFVFLPRRWGVERTFSWIGRTSPKLWAPSLSSPPSSCPSGGLPGRRS